LDAGDSGWVQGELAGCQHFNPGVHNAGDGVLKLACRSDARSGVRDRLKIAQDGRLRLWANGLAFSRSAIRTGVPGSSKNSRKELTR
jgi:hypothetical protein